MRCRRCQERLSEFVDGGLAARNAQAVAEHLAGCAVCAAVREDLSVMADRFRALGVEELADGARAGEAGDADGHVMWGRIEGALDEDEAQARRAARRLWRRIPALAPATAAVLLASGLGAGLLLEGRGTAIARSGHTVDEQLLREAGEQLARAEGDYRQAIDELCMRRHEDDSGAPCPPAEAQPMSPFAQPMPPIAQPNLLAGEQRFTERFDQVRGQIAAVEEELLPAAVEPVETAR